MNIISSLKEHAQDNLPPGAQGSFQRTKQLIANLARFPYRKARPEAVKLATGTFWKTRGKRLFKNHGSELSAAVLTGPKLLALLETGDVATIGSLGLMFDRFVELETTAEEAFQDTLLKSTFNSYLALRITQNELEEALFNVFGQRDWKQGWRSGRLGEEYGQNLEFDDKKRGQVMAKFIESNIMDGMAVGSRGSRSVAIGILEALAKTELAGSEGEKGKVGAEDRFWKQRGTEALPKLQKLLANSNYSEYPKVKGMTSTIPILKQDTLLRIVLNSVAKPDQVKKELNFDTLEMLGILHHKAVSSRNVKAFVTDPEAIAALMVLTTLRMMQTSMEIYLINSIGISDLMQRVHGRLMIGEYSEIIDSQEFLKNLVKRRAAKDVLK